MRGYLFGLAALAAFGATSADAQFYWQAPDFSGTPLTAGEMAMGVPLPGATLAEERANWAWQMRSALNVAAIQCRFDGTLLVADNYNGVLRNHQAELAEVYDTIRKYYVRTVNTKKDKKGAQRALDTYGTKTYSSFSAIRGQYGFCQTAAAIAKRAAMATRGSFTLFAIERLRELRNSLTPAGEQLFRFPSPHVQIAYPSFENKCWDRKGIYKARCGITYG